MAWSYVTSSNATGGTLASYTPLISGVQAQEHDLVVMTATCKGDGTTETALGMGVGWTLIAGVPVTDTTDGGLYVWYAIAGTEGALPDLTVTRTTGGETSHFHRAYVYRSSSGVPAKGAHALAANVAAGGTATLSDGVSSTAAGALIFAYATAGGATTYNSVTATDPSALSASNGTTHHSDDPEVDAWRQRGSLSSSAGSGYAYSPAETVKTSVGPTGPIVWGKNSSTRKSSLLAVSFEATGGSAPTPPQGTTTITNIAPGVTSATVTYSYSAGDATGFEYRIGGGTAASIGASPATISGLSAGTPYSVEVRAINADGEGAWSAAYNFTTSATADTTAPTLTLPSATSTGTTTASGSVSTNEANGTLYYRALSTASPSPTTIKSGSSQAVTTVGTQNVTVSGLTGTTAYYMHFLHRDEAGNDSAVATSEQFTTPSASGDTTPPTLTGPTGTATGATTASGTVSTNEGTGTLYWLASANVSETSSTVKAGSSQAVSAVGTQNVTVSGLTASTVYYLHYLHRDAAGNDSTVETSAQFTTAAPSSDTTPPALTGSVTFAGITGTSYTAQWPAGSDNVGVTGYEYQIGGTAGAWTNVGDHIAKVITGRTAGVTETVYVRAYDAAGNRSPAISGSVTLLSATASVTSAEFKNNTGTLLSGTTIPRVWLIPLGTPDYTNLVTNGAGRLVISEAGLSGDYLIVTANDAGTEVGVSKATTS